MGQIRNLVFYPIGSMGRTVCLPTFIVDLYGHSCREIYQSIPVPWIRHGYWKKKTWNFQVCFFCTATDLSPLPWDPVSLKLLQLSSVDGPSQVWPSLSPLYSLFFDEFLVHPIWIYLNNVRIPNSKTIIICQLTSLHRVHSDYRCQVTVFQLCVCYLSTKRKKSEWIWGYLR